MKVSVASEQRFHRLPDGSVWTQTQYGLGFWKRYLDVFDHVRCLARVLDVTELRGDWHRADGPGVSFAAVPYYVGVRAFARRWRHIRRSVGAASRPGDAFILRAPGNVSALVWRHLAAARYPYGVEVLGDPYAAFAPGAVRHPLRGPMRWHLWRQLRRQCANASAASYVTGQVLPDRYPSRGPVVVASDIELPDEGIVTTPRRFERIPVPVKLVFVGSLEQYYKAPDILIRALASCLARGMDLRLTMVGEGRNRAELERLAVTSGCADRIQFAGHLPAGGPIDAELDRSDLFVLPSRSEGLPRAVLEAMARGLPCIGSDAGGIPELLPADAIVPRGNVRALADKICEIARDPRRMTQLAATNLERIQAYRSVVLLERRVGFYREVRRATDAWLHGHGLPDNGLHAPACRVEESNSVVRPTAVR
jgi:glycosyltransferase involved in cell wall biosynthesis